MRKYLFKHRRIFGSLFLTIFIVGVFVLAQPAQALDLTEITGAAVNTMFGTFKRALITVINLLLLALLSLVVWVFSVSTSVLKDLLTFGAGMNDLPELVTAWRIVRDTMNSFFIVVLIAIAISTIIRFQQYNFRSTLPRLIIAAFLVNFSRTICLLAINASNSLMNTFGSVVADALPIFAIGLRLPAVAAFQDASIGGLYGIEKLVGEAKDPALATGELSLTITTIFGLLMALVATGAIVFFLILLLFRVIVLWFLTILSPLAFFLWGVPGRASSYWGQWLNEFVQHLLVGPVAAFFLYIILSLMIANVDKTYGGLISANIPQGTSTLISHPKIIFGYLVGIGMMFIALEIIQQMGVRGGALAQRVGVEGIIKGGLRGVRAAAGYANDYLYSKGLSAKPGQALQNIGAGIAARRQSWIQEGDRVMAKRVATSEEGGRGVRAMLWATTSGNQEFWEKNGVPQIAKRLYTGAKRKIVGGEMTAGLGELQERLEGMNDRKRAVATVDSWEAPSRAFVAGKNKVQLTADSLRIKATKEYLDDKKRETDLLEQRGKLSGPKLVDFKARNDAEITALTAKNGAFEAGKTAPELDALKQETKHDEAVKGSLDLYEAEKFKGVSANPGETVDDIRARVNAQVVSEESAAPGQKSKKQELLEEVTQRMSRSESAMSVARASFGSRITEQRQKMYPHMEDHDAVELANTALAHMNPRDKAEFAAPLIQAAEEGKIEEVLQVLDPDIDMSDTGMTKFTDVMKKRAGYTDDEAQELKLKIQAFSKKSGNHGWGTMVKRSSTGRIMDTKAGERELGLSKTLTSKSIRAALQGGRLGAIAQKKPNGQFELRDGFWAAVGATGRELDSVLMNVDKPGQHLPGDILKAIYKDFQKKPQLKRHISPAALEKLKRFLNEG